MIFFQNNNTTMRRSKTLQQQAKYYEVANEFKMMDVMLTSWIVGNSRKFKDYFKALNKENSSIMLGAIQKLVSFTIL